jgi:hypothetical protein
MHCVMSLLANFAGCVDPDRKVRRSRSGAKVSLAATLFGSIEIARHEQHSLRERWARPRSEGKSKCFQIPLHGVMEWATCHRSCDERGQCRNQSSVQTSKEKKPKNNSE